MPTCNDMLMGLNSGLGQYILKVKKNMSLNLHIMENAKAPNSVPKNIVGTQ
jgi:hypothetical protein